jgi:hypothetical protein
MGLIIKCISALSGAQRAVPPASLHFITIGRRFSCFQVGKSDKRERENESGLMGVSELLCGIIIIINISNERAT